MSETDIWDKKEFFESSSDDKVLFFYLYHNCNSVGIFEQALPIMSLKCGFEVTEEKILNSLLNVEKISEGKFWLRKFCWHQYGVLSDNSSNRPHASYIKALKIAGLYDKVKETYPAGAVELAEKGRKTKPKEDGNNNLKSEAIKLLNKE